MKERYPEGTTANIDDFRRSGWKAAIESSKRQGYSSMWDALSEAAVTTADAPQAKVLWLLADACAMRLKPTSANEPFLPIKSVEGRRTLLPDDFREPDVDLLAEISEEIDDHWLQARLADLAWLLSKPRNPIHALRAIDAYCAIPIGLDTWLQGGRECWERAITLTRSLRTAAGDRIQKIQSEIIRAFNAASEADGFLSLWLANLLLANGIGKDWQTSTAVRLEELARAFDQQGDRHRSREFFEAAAKCYKQVGDEGKAITMTTEIAEGWAKEAKAQVSPPQGSYMMVAGFYENAIKVYRSIPRKQRELRKVDERLAELFCLMNAAGERSTEELMVIESPPIDISGFVHAAREQVIGKSAIEALLALANIHPGFRVANIRQNAEKALRDNPLLWRFPSTHISRDGRVIARRSGTGPGEDDVWAEMIKSFDLEVHFIVQAEIVPALEIILVEHRLREADFVIQSVADRACCT